LNYFVGRDCFDLNYEEGLILLQDFIKKRPLIIVGSGLSISMGIPGMGGLLNHLSSTFPRKLSPDELVEWDSCLESINQYGFEEGLLRNKVTSNLLFRIVNETAEFIESFDENFHGKIHNMTLGDYPFATLLNHLLTSLPPSKTTVDVITTNYDHLVEYACDLIQCECCTGFKGSNIQFFKIDYLKETLYRRIRSSQKSKSGYDHRAITKVRLLKPHGSLKWQKKGDVTFHSPKLIEDTSRVIITPGNTKFEASLTDYVMNAHREFANECLNKAESVIILGYGFNDSHLQTVLNERLKSGLDCLILTRSLSDKAKKIISSCNQIIALEANSDIKTSWYYNGLEGTWDEPIWDMGHFVKKVI
jgi:SIR2-like domain